MNKFALVLLVLVAPVVHLFLAKGSEEKKTNDIIAFENNDTTSAPATLNICPQISEGWEKAMNNWRVHDMKRPQPPTIDPGIPGTQESGGKAPSDAIVLFDGKDLTRWEGVRDGTVKWIVKDGYFEVVPGTGDIRTIDSFGDCQLHIEWSTPYHQVGNNYDGNSGVFMMSKYEVQIFDTYRAKVYADGNPGAIYGEFPPDVNPCLSPGKWQTYDIIFHHPSFDENGFVIKPAIITLIYNGVVVQDNTEILGPTRWMSESLYEAHPDKLPLTLQDHSNPIRFRNIWIRPLPQGVQNSGPEMPEGITLSNTIMEQYVGTYGKGISVTIDHRDGKMMARIASLPFFELISLSENEFIGKRVDSRFVIDSDESGKVKGMTWYHGKTSSYYLKIK